MTTVEPIAVETTAPTVFLSHARVDSVRARKLAAVLTQAGVVVWWDALIEAGEAYARSIEAALEQADAVIVLWSKAAIESDWVRDEAGRGRDRKRLIPVSLDGSHPPLGFRQYQTVDFSRWSGRRNSPQIATLLQRLAAIEGQPAVPIARAAPVGTRRGVLAAGGAVTLAALAGGGIVARRGGWFGGGLAADSIAVVPFANLGGDASQSYFSDGLTEGIRAELARNARLRVLATTSSNTARGLTDDAVTIARKLGVAFLLGGSVQRADRMLRISAELIDGRTGFSRWADTFDRNLSDVFDVQSEIARTVAETLSLQLGASTPTPGGTSNVDAYEHFLRGRQLFNTASDEPTDRAALAQYDLAISADPNFAMAHAARSRSLAAIAAEYAKADELKPLYDDLIASARRAVALAANLAEANLALGYALYTGRLDIRGARPFYDRAYALGSGNADIVLLYALYCSRAGRAAEARRASARAVALDPLNPRAHRAEGSIAYAARLYAAALPPLKRALELKPDLSNAHSYIGASLLMMGQVAEARAEFGKESNRSFALAGIAIAERRLGHQAAASQALAQMRGELGDNSLYQQAEVLAQWGDGDRAIATLDRARMVGDSGLIYLGTDPMLDPLRRNPRFVTLARNLGFI